MLWVVECTDGRDGPEKRAKHREGHFAHLKANKQRILVCGPLQSEDRTRPIGSLLIVDFPDREGVEEFCGKDPFWIGGVFKTVDIKPFKKVDI